MVNIAIGGGSLRMLQQRSTSTITPRDGNFTTHIHSMASASLNALSCHRPHITAQTNTQTTAQINMKSSAKEGSNLDHSKSSLSLPFLLSTHTLLPLFTSPLPTPLNTTNPLPPNLQIRLLAPILLHHKNPQPLIFRLQLPNTLLQRQSLVLQILRSLLERLLALLLFDAEAG